MRVTRPNATTMVCNTLDNQAIRRLSKRVQEAIDVFVAAADDALDHQLIVFTGIEAGFRQQGVDLLRLLQGEHRLH